MFIRNRIRYDQIGLLFINGKFERVLGEGVHWTNIFAQHELEVLTLRYPVITHKRLIEIANALKPYGEVIHLTDSQRALVWVSGRFFQVLAAGSYFISNSIVDVRFEVVDARKVQFHHPAIAAIARSDQGQHLNVENVLPDHVGLLYLDGSFDSQLQPGRYAFWRQVSDVSLKLVDLREQAIDVNGQDLMTADKVTLRLNAIVTYVIDDARRSVSTSDNVHQAIYRATQLVLRTIVGQHPLDDFLEDKQKVAEVAKESLVARANELGIKIISVGVRDVILPGDMKDLMNRVIEARKSAEANLIFRREETAAIRSQANSAKLLESNPTLMRLRELEVLEKVAQSSNLKVVLSDGEGLSDRLRKIV